MIEKELPRSVATNISPIPIKSSRFSSLLAGNFSKPWPSLQPIRVLIIREFFLKKKQGQATICCDVNSLLVFEYSITAKKVPNLPAAWLAANICIILDLCTPSCNKVKK